MAQDEIGWADGDPYAERQFDELSTAEGLLIWSLRCWVTGGRKSPCARATLKEGFARAQVPGGERLLNLLLPLIAGDALRSIEIRCPGCSPTISGDEEIFLAAVGAAQAGNEARLTSQLSAFVPPTALRPILIVVHELADAFCDAGLRLPQLTAMGSAATQAEGIPPSVH